MMSSLWRKSLICTYEGREEEESEEREESGGEVRKVLRDEREVKTH